MKRIITDKFRKDVRELQAEGMSIREIASWLKVSPSTVWKATRTPEKLDGIRRTNQRIDRMGQAFKELEERVKALEKLARGGY